MLGQRSTGHGNAREATPVSGWRGKVIDLNDGDGDAIETKTIIDADLTVLDQSGIDGVAFLTLGGNRREAVAVVPHG